MIKLLTMARVLMFKKTKNCKKRIIEQYSWSLKASLNIWSVMVSPVMSKIANYTLYFKGFPGAKRRCMKSHNQNSDHYNGSCWYKLYSSQKTTRCYSWQYCRISIEIKDQLMWRRSLDNSIEKRSVQKKGINRR